MPSTVLQQTPTVTADRDKNECVTTAAQMVCWPMSKLAGQLTASGRLLQGLMPPIPPLHTDDPIARCLGLAELLHHAAAAA